MIELFSIYAGLVSLLQRIFLARIMRKDHNEYVFYDCKALKLIQAQFGQYIDSVTNLEVFTFFMLYILLIMPFRAISNNNPLLQILDL